MGPIYSLQTLLLSSARRVCCADDPKSEMVPDEALDNSYGWKGDSFTVFVVGYIEERQTIEGEEKTCVQSDYGYWRWLSKGVME